MQGQSTSRMFVGSCTAIVALAFSFAALSGIMYQLKGVFRLDNAQIGLIGGAGLWGMAISQVGFSSLCDTLGMRNLMRLAALGHIAGVALIIFATGFELLFAGALVLAVANGMVEAVCNPLVATLYPDRKAAMLNRLHLWFPGGIVLGGLAVWGLAQIGADWRVVMAIVVAPTILYAWLFAGLTFPATEAAQNGARMSDAFRAVATAPILWLFLVLMAITMSLELGPNRWIPAVLEAGGMPGILVLVLINGVMAVARYNAHAILARASPPVLLMAGTGTAGIGLLWLSYAAGPSETIAAALVFAVGIALVWPTMMGFVAERVPRTGALGLGLMAAAGSLAVGVITTPLLGQIADSHLADTVPTTQVQQLAARAPDLAAGKETGVFLRAAAEGRGGPELAVDAKPILAAAENKSGLLSFRYLVPFAAFVSLIFGLVTLRDRRAGGYAAQVDRAKFKQSFKQGA